MRPAVRLAAGAVLLVLLAGCVEPSPPFSAREIPDTAPAEAGHGPRTVTVHVVAEDGPVPAHVAVWWLDDEQPDDQRVLRGAGLRLFGPDGTVVAHVPDDKAIHVAAATDERRTEEWVVDAFAPGSDDTATVRLYEVARTLRVEDVWNERLVVSLAEYAPVEARWYPVEPSFSADPAWDAGYKERVARVSGALEWVNDGLHMADFGVLVAPEDGPAPYCHIQDDDPDLEPGVRVQEFRLPYRTRCPPETLVQAVEAPARVGPAVDSHAVGIDGLPFSIDLDVQLFRWNGWQDHASHRETAFEIDWDGKGASGPVSVPPTPAPPPTRPATPADTTSGEDLQGWSDPYGPGSFLMNVFFGGFLLVVGALVVASRRR